jgi:DUF971 family protein
MGAPSPVEINHIKSKGAVRVTWDDGHVGEYAQDYLRGFCPCAGCQGHGGELKFHPSPDAVLAAISGVGNYAIMFHWQDGHETGIYTYQFLRALCPCAECKSRAEAAESKE